MEQTQSVVPPARPLASSVRRQLQPASGLAVERRTRRRAPPPRQNVQYNTGFLLPPGQLSAEVRGAGEPERSLGSFESDVTVPDQHKEKLKLSSLILSSQNVVAARKPQPSPLIRDGQEIIPNLAHVFTTSQTATFFYEVYDPAPGGGEELDPPVDQHRLLPRPGEGLRDAAGGNHRAERAGAKGRGL